MGQISAGEEVQYLGIEGITQPCVEAIEHLLHRYSRIKAVRLITYGTAHAFVITLGESDHVVGLVDLSGFGSEHNVGQLVLDYYFQLKRVSPNIDPVFIFPHELVDENGQTFRSLMYKLGHMHIQFNK